MVLFLLPMALVIASGVLYHATLAAFSGGPSPWLMLAPAYGVACALSCGLWWLSPNARLTFEPRQLAGSVLLAVAVVGIEAGFFFAYRAGWRLSRASLVSSAAVAAALLLLSVWRSGEALSLRQLGGMALAGAGAWLMASR